MTTVDEAQDVAWVRALCATGANQVIRTNSRLSLREVAAPLRVSPTTVQRWETGASVPTGRRAIEYAQLLRSLSSPRGRRRVGGDAA